LSAETSTTSGVLGFSHMQLLATDVEASAAWFQLVLGMDELGRGPLADGVGRYVALRHPTAKFVIGIQTATDDERPGIRAGAVEHLSFAVADLATLETRRSDLAAAGIDVDPIHDEAASHNVRMRSPDGLIVELTTPRAR
jgi:catechol 2,3-dioxygenase-like lactoylglutathione lyase family enzyme